MLVTCNIYNTSHTCLFSQEIGYLRNSSGLRSAQYKFAVFSIMHTEYIINNCHENYTNDLIPIITCSFLIL